MNSDYISDNIPLQRILNTVIPILMQFPFKLEHCKPHKAACYPTKCEVIDDVKLFPTVYIAGYTVANS